MRERTIETYLVRQAEKQGWDCWKLGGSAGIPDRLLIVPNWGAIFVEVKTQGGVLSKLQKWRILILEKGNQKTKVIWSKADVDNLIANIKEDMNATS